MHGSRGHRAVNAYNAKGKPVSIGRVPVTSSKCSSRRNPRLDRWPKRIEQKTHAKG